MTLDELRQPYPIGMVGMPFTKLDNDGHGLGCFAPVYALYPAFKRYSWPKPDTFRVEIVAGLDDNMKPVPLTEMMPGDVLAFRMPFGYMHVGVYLGNDEIIHGFTDETIQICRLSLIVRRLEACYRWDLSEQRLRQYSVRV